MPENLGRSTVNSEQYAAPEFQKSGFNHSYSRRTSYMLGRMHVGAYHHCMPGDRISGVNSFDGTFHDISTPLVTPVRGMSYNFFLPWRAVDTSFMKGMTPTKLNGMSASWKTPTINTSKLISQLFEAYFSTYEPVDANDHWQDTVFSGFYSCLSDPTQTISDVFQTGGVYDSDILYEAGHGIIACLIESLTNPNGDLYQMAEKLYLIDALQDIASNIIVKLGDPSDTSAYISPSTTIYDFMVTYLDCVLSPFVGRYSYYGEFKYPYVRPKDIKLLLQNRYSSTPATWLQFLNLFNTEEKCEYSIRVMYAIWYERFRNVDLEPVNSNLPDWREFGSTSILDVANGGNLCFLIYRIRSWEKDMFTTAQIDDISRHVYAPILASPATGVKYHGQDVNNLDAQENNGTGTSPGQYSSAKPASYDLTYRDQLSDTDKTVFCPVPSNINDMLSSLDMSATDVYGLDLNTLRQSQMLERYLKRNYLFGDEYQDRLLAHYNSRLSDMRINRPELLSQTINDYSPKQEIANQDNGVVNAGTRTATATIQFGGDQFTTYCEEFGTVVTIVTFMPVPMYDGDDAHNSLTKQVHFPLPEFASNNEEFGRKDEIAGTGLAYNITGSSDDDLRFIFGRYPAYHIWRSRVDEVGGEFLDEMQDCTFRRFWGNYSLETTPKLNYFFIHCRPNLQMFRNTNLYDCQLYGTLVNQCFVERVLPTPVETI